MNSADEIQAAIDTLTQLREACSPGSWSVSHGEDGTAIEWARGDSVSSPYVALLADANSDDFNPDPGGSDNDAYLIVTLHRTIDAQLAILREVDFQLSGNPERVTFSGDEYNLFVALARAINGGTK